MAVRSNDENNSRGLAGLARGYMDWDYLAPSHHPAFVLCPSTPTIADVELRGSLAKYTEQRAASTRPGPLPPGTWPKASDEADGNTGRPQPGFFRITGKNISYSTDLKSDEFFVFF